MCRWFIKKNYVLFFVEFKFDVSDGEDQYGADEPSKADRTVLS